MRVRGKQDSAKHILLPEPDFLPKRSRDKTLPRVQYKPEFARQAFFLTLLGLTVVQMAQVLGISPGTIKSWMDKHPEFAQAILNGREEADGKVAHSLFQVANGYEHPDQIVLTNRKREYDSVTGKVVREWTEPLIVDVIKRYPPNVTAAIKWLKARRPDVWGNKLEVKGQITMHHKVDLSKFTTKELEVLNKLGLQSQAEDTEFEEIK